METKELLKQGAGKAGGRQPFSLQARSPGRLPAHPSRAARRPTWAEVPVVAAAVQGGKASLVAVAEPVGSVGSPTGARALQAPARAAASQLSTAARRARRGQQGGEEQRARQAPRAAGNRHGWPGRLGREAREKTPGAGCRTTPTPPRALLAEATRLKSEVT